MKLERNIQRALSSFEKAVVNKAFKGSRMPEEHAEIDKQYRHTKQRLIEILKRVPHE